MVGKLPHISTDIAIAISPIIETAPIDVLDKFMKFSCKANEQWCNDFGALKLQSSARYGK
jgi:hypothetical protein